MRISEETQITSILQYALKWSWGPTIIPINDIDIIYRYNHQSDLNLSLIRISFRLAIHRSNLKMWLGIK